MALSRAIFREYDIRGVAGKDLTEEAATLVAGAYAAFLAEKGVKGTLAVGRDNRPSGKKLHAALVAGLLASGIDVVDIGIVPTPLAYWSQHNLDVIGGIQITGSHNPPEYNGFKLGLGTTSIYGADIQHLYDLAVAGKFPRGKGSLRKEEVIDRYVTDIATRVGKLSRDLKVVIDCGNGAGSLVAPQLFPKLGIEPRCLFCESDGTFPNHHPDPTVLENLKDLQAAVVRERAELGIAFDGDGDRIGAVDERGTPVFGDQLLVLFGRDLARRFGAGKPVIFDVKCSEVLPRMLKLAGLVPIMWKTGHSLIKQKMKETGAPLAGEMSGHVFFGGDWYGFDDALFAAARLLHYVAREGGPLSRLLADLPPTVSTPELRVDCADERKFAVVERAAAHFAAKYPVFTLDGVRITFADGWGLLRASNTQPVLVLRFEATSATALAAYRAEVEGWLAANGVAV